MPREGTIPMTRATATLAAPTRVALRGAHRDRRAASTRVSSTNASVAVARVIGMVPSRGIFRFFAKGVTQPAPEAREGTYVHAAWVYSTMAQLRERLE